MYNIFKWVILKLKQVEAVVLDEKEPIQWTKGNAESTNSIVNTIQSILEPTTEFNKRRPS